MIDPVILIYGVVTVCLMLWCFLRGDLGLKLIGAITFIGWVYYQAVMHLTHYTTEQWVLALGDAVQAIAIMWIVVRTKLGRVTFWGFATAFLGMMALHLSIILKTPQEFSKYYTSLNYAYVLQLLTLGGTMLRHELKGIALRRDTHSSDNRSQRGGVLR